MRHINYKVIVSLILIVIGVFLILFAQHSLYKPPAAENQPFFMHVRDWFVGVGDWFKGLAVPKQTLPQHSLLSMKVTLWVGIIVTALGALMLIFCGKKKI
jgi:hypothetical protein